LFFSFHVLFVWCCYVVDTIVLSYILSPFSFWYFITTITSILIYHIQLAIITQGIAARYARRQASSEKAFVYQKVFPLFGTLAKQALVDAGYQIDDGPDSKAQAKAKL
jgi:hypothetical protein